MGINLDDLRLRRATLKPANDAICNMVSCTHDLSTCKYVEAQAEP